GRRVAARGGPADGGRGERAVGRPGGPGPGVGTALLRHAERQMAAAGHGRAWLTCSGFNPGAVRFYLARGYREVGRGTKDRGGGVVEELLTFERRLSQAEQAEPSAAPGPAPNLASPGS